MHVDLAYLPSGASSATVDVDFFTRVLSSCYIISGDGPEREELMRQTLDALLDGKATWSEAAQVRGASDPIKSAFQRNSNLSKKIFPKQKIVIIAISKLLGVLKQLGLISRLINHKGQLQGS